MSICNKVTQDVEKSSKFNYHITANFENQTFGN